MDPIVIPLFFIAAVALASVFFIIWAVLKVALFVLYILLLPVRWLFGGHRQPPMTPPGKVQPQYSRQGTRCGFQNCLALNPTNARFCGRCGSSLSVWGGDHYHYPPRSTQPTERRVAHQPQVDYVA
ncbi:MAG: hypothetical protein AAGD32_17655 [Planctomycetota bacterium]